MQRRTLGGLVWTAWFYAAVAVVLGYLIPRIARGPLGAVNTHVERDQVLAFLSAVSSGMMAFTGISFAMMFVVLQFGSTAYSPQIVPLFARNPTLYHAGGVFTGTFLFSLMALRGVGSAPGGHTTMIVIWTVFAWLFASVYMLLRLVAVFGALTLTDVLEMLTDVGYREIRRVYYEAPASRRRAESGSHTRKGRVQRVMHQARTRYVRAIDVPALVQLAHTHDAVIRVGVAIGDPLTWGSCLATVEHRGPAIPEEAVRRAIELGADRTGEHGPKYAIRTMVDIAVRALSPGINDPTTAVRVLDHLESLLVALGQSNLEIGKASDDDGIVRVVYPATSWEEYLDLALTEIQDYGATSVQVERRLAALYDFLRGTVSERRRGAVERRALEREALLDVTFRGGRPRERAEEGDREGLGHPVLE